MSRAAVFDLDGTLAETAGDFLGAVNTLLAEEGEEPFDAGAARRLIGRGGKHLVRAAFSRNGRALDDAGHLALHRRFLTIYAGRVAQESFLYDGVPETLDALASDGWRLGVCTNKPGAMAHDLLRALDIHHRFGAIVAADTLPVRKPDPRPFLEVARRLGVDPLDAVLVGDTINDLRCARAVGVPVILTSFGHGERPARDYAPDAVVDDFRALPPLIESLYARRERA